MEKILKDVVDFVAIFNDPKVLNVLTGICLVGAVVFFILFKMRHKKNMANTEYTDKLKTLSAKERAEKERMAKEYKTENSDDLYSDWEDDDSDYEDDTSYDEYDDSDDDISEGKSSDNEIVFVDDKENYD